jgi:phosphohistidine phosphatase
MAAQLWLLRHGEAEPHGLRPDEERRLTERGERQASAAGATLAALGVRLDAVFTSPRVRALDTARLACEAFSGTIEPQLHAPLSTGFDGPEALRLLERSGADAHVHPAQDAHVLVVGHEPSFSETVHELTGARIDLKKGGLAAVRIGAPASGLSGTGGELVVLARPRELALIAGMAV